MPVKEGPYPQLTDVEIGVQGVDQNRKGDHTQQIWTFIRVPSWQEQHSTVVRGHSVYWNCGIAVPTQCTLGPPKKHVVLGRASMN